MQDRLRSKSVDDEFLIKRCVKLARQSFKNGDSPFGSLITDGHKIVVEALNARNINSDITLHAEIIAIRKAQKLLGKSNFTGYTLYTICEPCPMCAFMIREARFSRVVFSLCSPHMGGLSKWAILQDLELEKFSDYFCYPPEVTLGILVRESRKFFSSIGWDNMLS